MLNGSVESKTVDEAAHDITNNHIIAGKNRGKDGGLSTNEKIKTGATAADIAGTVMSFIPGVNVLGAGLSVGSDLARFYAEAKQDGLDKGDVWRLIGNLGMDALTIIPVIGGLGKLGKLGKAAAKTTKAASTAAQADKAAQEAVKAASKVVKTTDATRKVSTAGKVARGLMPGIQAGFGVYGFTTQALPVINKALDGEDITSQDAAQLAYGLMATGLGAKGAADVVKNAKVASESAKILNSKARSTMRDAKIAGKNVKLSVDELAGLEGKSLDEVTDFLKGKGLEGEEVATAMKNLGIDMKKSGAPKLWGKGFGKRGKTATIDTGEVPNESFWSNIWSPIDAQDYIIKRAGQMNADELSNYLDLAKGTRRSAMQRLMNAGASRADARQIYRNANIFSNLTG